MPGITSTPIIVPQLGVGPAGPAGARSGFGDGSDGAADFDGVTTPPGSVRSGGTYTLVRDVFYTTVNVRSGIAIRYVKSSVGGVPGSFRMFATVRVTNDGLIDASGVTSSSAAVAALNPDVNPGWISLVTPPFTTLGTGMNGRQGLVGNGLAGASPPAPSWGGAGGAGGAGAGGLTAGGAGGAAFAPGIWDSVRYAPMSVLLELEASGLTMTFLAIIAATDTRYFGGAGGGSGGGVDQQGRARAAGARSPVSSAREARAALEAASS